MMHAPIFDQLLQERRKRQPFQPFVIEFDDGRSLLVDKPETLMYPSYGNTVYFAPNGDITLVDCEAVKQFSEVGPASVG
jgi:hypothetical protein